MSHLRRRGDLCIVVKNPPPGAVQEPDVLLAKAGHKLRQTSPPLQQVKEDAMSSQQRSVTTMHVYSTGTDRRAPTNRPPLPLLLKACPTLKLTQGHRCLSWQNSSRSLPTQRYATALNAKT